jgi:hypothetical protein
MPVRRRDVKWRVPITTPLKIHVTARSNELLSDGCIPTFGCEVQRRVPMRVLKIDTTTRKNELLRDCRMPLTGRVEERVAPRRVLVVDEKLRALCGQERANLRCVTNTRGLAKLLPRHIFPVSCCPVILLRLN